MKIDFERMEDTVIPNFKNGTGVFVAKMFDDKKTKIMRATLAPGSSVGLHAHNDSSEIIYILSGSARAIYDAGDEKLSAGDVHYCPKGHVHSLINESNEDLVFLAIVPNLS